MQKKKQPHLLTPLLFTLLISGCASMANENQPATVESASDKSNSLEMYVFPKRANEEGYKVKFER